MKKKASENEEYQRLLAGWKIPILTLDHKWHKLFVQMEPDRRLKELESKLNSLLKRQGKLNTEYKDIRKLKKKLMHGIVEMMNLEDNLSKKKTEESRRLIEDCNGKTAAYKQELDTLPEEIDACNRALMLRTMEVCYDVLQQNAKEIEESGKWINKTRIELKKAIVRKQEKELKNHELYSYLHDIFGAEITETFDARYHLPGDVYQAEQKQKAGKEKA